MTKFNDFLKEQLNDLALRAEYEALEPEFTIIQAMIDARKSAGLTQKQLSEKTGMLIRHCGRFDGWPAAWGCG